jgi:lipoprotein-anchoring transpeptidase ErfK/SrfK
MKFVKNEEAILMNRRNLIKYASILAIAGVGMARGIPSALAAQDAGERFRISTGDARKVRRKFRKREVAFETLELPGTIIVDPHSRYLYLTLGGGRAMHYGIGVGRQGFEWSGDAVIQRKAKWPRWTPPKAMVERDHFARQWANGMPGGPKNPLGARALYLYQGGVDTLYRIHGTSEPQTIGSAVSSGCIRLIHADVADLYERVRVGAKVVVLEAPLNLAEEEPRNLLRQILDRDR